MNLFLYGNNVFRDVYDWVVMNPWILFVIGGVVAIFVVLVDLKKGRPKAIEEIENKYDYDEEIYALKDILKRDILTLVLNVIFFAIPIIVYIILYFAAEDFLYYAYNGWVRLGFLIYYAVATIAISIFRKDPGLLFLWKIPTLSLFRKTHDVVDDGTYDIDFDKEGKPMVTEHFGVTTALMGILGVILFVIKVNVMGVYLVILAFGNIVLSTVAYPIMYGILIAKDVKAIKNLEEDNYYGY